MIKLIYSDDFDPIVGVGAQIVDKDQALKKQASTIFGCDYSDMKPDKDHVGIHVVALGDSEHYPFNRNSDGFPKKACEKYHDTFVKFGHVYRHHRNKDPNKSIGIIKASAYNDKMGRIELYIHADKEKAAPELERLEKEGEVPFSMACLYAGTLIQKSSGMTTIENIVPGDTVLTHAGKIKSVSAVMSRTVSEYYDIKFTSWGRTVLSITGNHPVYACSFDDVERGYRKDRSEHPGKGWKRRHRNVLHKYLKWTPASELTDTSYIGVPICREISSGIDIKTSRLFGYYIAEGSLGSEDNICVCITCNKSDDVVSEIQDLYNWTGVKFYNHSSSDKAYNIRCHGIEIARRIQNECGRCCQNKRIPYSIKTAPTESKFNFAAAWFNGDGWQDKKGLHWSTCSQSLAIELQQLLASLDIPSSCSRIDHPDHRGKITSENAIEYVVSISNEFSGLFCDISKAEEIEIQGTTKYRTFISGDYLMVPVASVTKIECGEPVTVYNFSVDEDESYTAYGLAVHNCQVKFDRCSVCNNLRKQAGDESECEHIRNHLGELRDDGIKIGTYNDEPHFFDISFVGRPADRIAWNLKIASGLPISSVKQAEYEGITAPDELAITDPTALRKLDYLKQLSDYQKQYTGWVTKSAAVITTKDRYLWELRKVAASSLDSETIESLRRLPPKLAFSVLGNSGVIMDVPTFFKYAMGPEYDTVKEYIPGVSVKVASIIEDSVDNNDCQTICNDTTFDTDLKYRDAKLESKLASAALTNDLKNKILIATIDNKIPNWNIDKRLEVCSNGIIDKLAEKYAAYELSAIDAVLQGRNDITQTIALTATHNLQD